MEIYGLILEDFRIIIPVTMLLAIVLYFLLFPNNSQSLRPIFNRRRASERFHLTKWLEDEVFMECFGDLHQRLYSEESRRILGEYEEKGSHVTHFFFIVHGLSGLSKDFAYAETVMNLYSDEKKLELAQNKTAVRQNLLIHVVKCNERKTFDGIENGGNRLVREMMDTIRQYMSEQPLPEDQKEGELRQITVSLWGNSLGGLYCRYALAHFAEATNMILDDKYKIEFNIFCSTASPHLGVSKQTYLPLPRSAELVTARTMGTTFKDLFRVSDLIRIMATTPQYLRPLAKFRKRIAYANAYGTDLMVPASTAAFLHSASTYPHHWDASDYKEGDDFLVVDEIGHVVATLHTPSLEESDHALEAPDDTDELAFMSHSLDSLGWKKVFVDLRHEIPIGVTLPSFQRKGQDASSNGEAKPTARSPLDSLKTRGVVSSADVASVTKLPPDLKRISFPAAHNMIVAYSRCTNSATFNKGGRPVVDALAKELIDFIFSWQKQQSTTSVKL